MKKKILLVDDDALVLKSISNLLSRVGYEVVCAKDCESAEREFTKNKIDLVICDIRMPGSDGVVVVKKLKEMTQNKKGSETPFIFITGYASEEAPIDAIKLGVKDYILKPFDLDELLTSVKKNLQASTSE